MKNILHKMYLSYVNDFLTIASFMEFYGVNFNTAIRILKIGKRLHIKSYK